MIDSEHQSLPEVGQHPEVLEILKRIGKEEISAEAGYHQLADIVSQYLWHGASEGHGELIGSHIVRILTPGKSSQVVPMNDPEIWREQLSEPASPLAVARGVLQISVFLGIPMGETDVWRGAQRLYDEKMKLIFPPSPLLFGTTFTVLRKRI